MICATLLSWYKALNAVSSSARNRGLCLLKKDHAPLVMALELLVAHPKFTGNILTMSRQ